MNARPPAVPPARPGSPGGAALAWSLLAVLVTASAVLRHRIAQGHPAPFVFFDELLYSELARGLAEAGELRLRDVPVRGFSPGYPLLLSLAYRLHEDLGLAYSTAKLINSICMSLAAVPAYLLGRRVLGRAGSLFVALFSVAIPSMNYTASLLTENLF